MHFCKTLFRKYRIYIKFRYSKKYCTVRVLLKMIIINSNLLKMKKLFYLFVIIAGMTLAAVNVNAQDPKCAAKCAAAAGKKDATAACCKAGEKMSCGKEASKETASASSKKDSGTAGQKSGTSACCAAKAGSAVSEVKDQKSPK